MEFHGHMCPGLALGIQAAQIALSEIGAHAQDEEVVATVETDMCAVDAIQFLTGCTFGKGNLIHRDLGKNAYTFWRRSDGRAIRILGKPGVRRRDPEHQELFERLAAGDPRPSMEERYGDERAFAAKIEAAAASLVHKGFMLEEDKARTVQRATTHGFNLWKAPLPH